MIRVASVNVNGVRAAFRKGMQPWLDASGVDVLALQEVRAEREDLVALLGDEWIVANDEASAKGRAGVAIATRAHQDAIRTTLGPDTVDTAGRWIEVDITTPEGNPLTIVSCYVHSGEAGTPKQDAKYEFLDIMSGRMQEIGTQSEYALVVGDLNVGHRSLDIRNWKGNLKNSGFLPQERAYFDQWIGSEQDPSYNTGSEGRFIDIGRAHSGEVEGPYSWWSWRGKAFDNDTGWRIDYQLATKKLADSLRDYRIDRAPSYDTRWSDHAPVIADYDI
ncbi:MAG: exodeoxyribonuclease III [Microbacteriaceae bacterium]|nr:exodeoxyribonuclease III [Microbacteriaceae bacterium]